MKTSRMLAPVGAALLLALLAPLGADARPPQPAGSAPPQASLLARLPSIAGARLVISQLTSAPTHVRAGRTYVVRGSDRERGRGRRARASRRSSPPRRQHGRSRSAVRPSASRAHDFGADSAFASGLPRTPPRRLVRARRVRAARRAKRRARVRDGGAASPDRIAVAHARRARLAGCVERSRARRAHIRCRRSARTSIRRPATAATRASTPTSS